MKTKSKNPIEHLIDDGTVQFVLASGHRYDKKTVLFAVVETVRMISPNGRGGWDKKLFQKVLKKENGFLILDPQVYQTTSRGYVRGEDWMYPNFKTEFKNYEDYELHAETLRLATEKHAMEQELKRQENIKESNKYRLDKWNDICENGWQSRVVSKETISNLPFTKYTFNAVLVKEKQKKFDYFVTVLVSDEPVKFGYAFGDENNKKYSYFVSYCGLCSYNDGDVCQEANSYKDKEDGNSEEAIKQHLVQNLVGYFN